MAEQSVDPAQPITPTKASSSSPPGPRDSPDVPPSAADGPPTSDDPIALASPLGSPLTEADDIALVEGICAPRTEGGPPFYIEVPVIPEEQKTLYETVFGDRYMVPDSAPEATELTDIAGEHEIDGTLYYFARDPERTLHRFPEDILRRTRSDLVEKYKQAKAAGSLGPFDPSASYVHVESRVRFQVHIKRPTAKKSRLRHKSSSPDEFAASYRSDSDTLSSHTHVRTATKGTKMATRQLKLPYSPKKTRAQGRAVVAPASDEDSDSDVREISAPPRRSARAKRSNLNDADFVADSEDDSDEVADSDDEEYGGKGRLKRVVKKKPAKKKGSRAAYGRFRPIADMELDEEVDEESAVLRIHRRTCEKCHRPPTHQALAEARKKKPGRRRKKGSDEESSEDEIERLEALGGWVRCLKCPVAAHWACLAKTQRDEILKAAFERDKAEWQAAKDRAAEKGEEFDPPDVIKRVELEPEQSTDFICTSCMKGGVCMACREVVVKPDVPTEEKREENPQAAASGAPSSDVEMADATGESKSEKPPSDDKDEESTEDSKELAFRCITCKRLAHYAHLPIPADWDYDPEDVTATMLADHYQTVNNWQCGDCSSFVYGVEHILAWRPYPEDAVEPSRPAGEPANYKALLPREYLVKWADRSYRRTSWVPHGWLLATSSAKLKNFLLAGSKIPLLSEPVEEEKAQEPDASQGPSFEIGREDSADVASKEEKAPFSALDPNPDAERKIPPAWKRVDRVLDVLLWRPEGRQEAKKRKQGRGRKGKGKGKKREESDAEDASDDNAQMAMIRRELDAAYDLGEQPSSDLTETVEEYELRTKRRLNPGDAHLVVWGFFKWDDLGYDNASWDSPPRPGDSGYAAFQTAFERYVAARAVTVPLKNESELDIFDNGRQKNAWRKKFAFTSEKQPQNGQDAQFKLMPFQIDGVNWLCDNWWNHQNCILADEMGLGKTVQIASFIGHVASQHQAFPVLVVVPNSTISNWVREFERWAPKLRVVPFYGEAKARDIIKRYELFHPKDSVPETQTGAKYHVLVTTYETITNPKDFTPVFKNMPRWEVLVVDEGQRLKSDASLIFKKLKDLNTIHRVIMTGTPLNNNIRELFNLMNFLDPGEWTDLVGLAKQYEELTEDKVKELHTRLKPYFLRRIKSEVLQLPPKNEVIVPVSMTPLQKEVYRSILSQNLGILRNLVAGSAGARVNAAISKSNMNNMLMQLRKCLQHPYLVSKEIEPKGLSPEETHAKLIDASSKLGLLKLLLPKLRERGHRVLLFSQFSIALDVIEDFLIGERIKYLRLDGNTKQSDRQKDMDEFNKPDSDIFMYILTTRAGGVGINLWTADTVIIFDPDFNPHQDLQAIARSHRYGQKKTCLVFKLMVKGSAEDKIMQTGKKKLVLDHLIVQKMDDDDGSKEDVQSILMFGAQALFEEGNNGEDRQIHYSEHDIDKLIERTEKEGDQVESEVSANQAFSFAKIWSADKDELEEVQDDVNGDQLDSWAQTLERIAAERIKTQTAEMTGRGVRRKAAAVFPQQDHGPEERDATTKDGKKPAKGKGKGKKSKSVVSEDSDAYAEPGSASDSDSSANHPMSVQGDDFIAELVQKRRPETDSFEGQATLAMGREGLQPLSPIQNTNDPRCGLCGGYHGDQPCALTESSENLAQFRLMLLVHAGDEPIEDRRAAIQVIDETLHKRGMMHLIYGQPMHLVERPAQEGKPPQKKAKTGPPLPFGLLGRGSVPTSSEVAGTSGNTQTAKHNGSGSVSTTSSARVDSAPSFGRSDKPRAVPTLPRHGIVSQDVAGPSKRPSSPIVPPESPRAKKTKSAGATGCPVCGGNVHHLVKDCPDVRAGPKRVKKAIRRLENDPAQQATVNALRHILTKQQKRAIASAPPPAQAIELSD